MKTGVIRNMSIRNKLVLALAIPIVAMIIISVLSIVAVNSIFGNMEDKIEKQSYSSITLVLNADRDLYQAMLAAEQNMFESSDKAEKDKHKETVISNISGQDGVSDRIGKAKAKFDPNDPFWKEFRDKDNKTIQQNFETFQVLLAKWEKDIVNGLNSGTSNTYVEEFDAARGVLNNIGEMIDSGTAKVIENSRAEKDRLVWLVVIINVVILVILLGVTYVLINVISKPVKELTDVAEKLALGDTEFNIVLDSSDEIGRLKKAFSVMVDAIRMKTEAASQIAQGNLDVKLVVQSEKDSLTISMLKLKDTLLQMVHDTNALTDAALNGELSVRADASKHQGEFKRIVDGINATLDAVIRPVNEVSAVMEEVSRGNLGVSIRSDYRGDYKKLADSVNNTIFNLKSIIDEIAEVLQQVSDGVLDMEDIHEYSGEFGRISASINTLIDSFNDLVGDISKASDQVASGSRQVSEGSMQLSQGATEQASSIEELSASMTQVAQQTKMNATNASQANQLALTAKNDAVRGNERMQDMLKAMDDINEASENISKIIKVIDDIAFQTNILALNAAVEAARAGQHGKGFAVVAEEVRNLAARSADAAHETTEYIESSIKKVDGGAKIAQDTAASLLGIVESSARVADLVGNIATASNEQASGIAQINLGIEQVSKVIQTNSATAQESAAASEELMSQAQMLNDNVSRFSLRGSNGMRMFDADDEIFSKPQMRTKKGSTSQTSGGRTSKTGKAGKSASAAKDNMYVKPGNYDYGKY